MLFPRQTSMNNNVNVDVFSKLQHLKTLRVAHRLLDASITSLGHDVLADQLQVQRMKKEKLRLRDLITRLESEMIPDLNA